MTATTGDGIEEDLTRAVGMAMIAASRAGEQMARMRQSADRERQARAAGDAQQAERELAAHTEAARAYFDVVTCPEYLTAATDERIRDVTRQAQAWRERLPEAQRAANAATGELGARRPTPDTGSQQQAAVLAGQAEAADQPAAGEQQPADGAAPETPQGWDRVGKYYGHDGSQPDTQQQPGQQAAATAANAQARPAREAPAAGRTTTSRQDRRVAAAASPARQHPEVGR